MTLECWMQLRPIVYYTWDASVIQTSGNISNLNLSSSGIRTLSPKAECKYGTCARFNSGNYFTIPPHSFAQYAGFSFSVWYKPMAGSGQTARIFEMADKSGQISLSIGRSSLSSRIELSVRRSAMASSLFTTGDGAWQEGAWKHIAWTMAPNVDATNAAMWKIYLDGNLSATVPGLYPANVLYTQSFIGQSMTRTNGIYVGYFDSFAIFPGVLTDNEVRIIYAVSARLMHKMTLVMYLVMTLVYRVRCLQKLSLFDRKL
jgi:hypothetical protein